MTCGSSRLHQFLDLGHQPNGNHFPSIDGFDTEPQFPFAMAVCEDCWQVQIEEFPSPEFMFANHPYITGVNMPVVSHFEQMIDDVIKKFMLPKNSLVIDIGANDGTLLKCFEKRGMRILGIDPGQRTGKLARDRGVTVCETFWNQETALSIKQLNLKPNLITATAVFYHIEDIHSFVRGLRDLMDDQTIFLTQCVYMKDVLEKLQFDHFYHEHTLMHSLLPLEKLFQQYGLRMIDVDFYPVHGGSFALYVAKDSSSYKTQPSIAKALQDECDAGLNHIDTYLHFADRVKKNRDDLVSLLKKLRDAGHSIYALGAPLKGSTLLNYCNIGPNLVELATEVNRFKIGKYTPGTHIPIVFEDSLDHHPDYYLLLSWNFKDFFIEKYADYLKGGGKFIVPHPTVRVIGST